MVATAIYSVTMVLWKETAFPLCRAMERRWKRNVRLPGIFCDSGDTPANLLCELNGHLMPCTSCFYGKWVKDVCAGQFAVFVYLVLRCLLGCCIWFSCCAANVGLSICVWYCYVPDNVTVTLRYYYFKAHQRRAEGRKTRLLLQMSTVWAGTLSPGSPLILLDVHSTSRLRRPGRYC